MPPERHQAGCSGHGKCKPLGIIARGQSGLQVSSIPMDLTYGIIHFLAISGSVVNVPHGVLETR